jgi:hypothetical protein
VKAAVSKGDSGGCGVCGHGGLSFLLGGGGKRR